MRGRRGRRGVRGGTDSSILFPAGCVVTCYSYLIYLVPCSSLNCSQLYLPTLGRQRVGQWRRWKGSGLLACGGFAECAGSHIWA